MNTRQMNRDKLPQSCMTNCEGILRSRRNVEGGDVDVNRVEEREEELGVNDQGMREREREHKGLGMLNIMRLTGLHD